MDWVVASSIATAAGTLVLAVATFASVRSANRAARAAEQARLSGLRPLLVPSHLHDHEQKIRFIDEKWVKVPGGGGVAERGDEAIYLALSLRNVGSGIAVLHSWQIHDPTAGPSADRPDPAVFHRLTRDLYVPVADTGFWQGALRDPAHPDFVHSARGIRERQPLTVDVLYGDYEGGQRVISRFTLQPLGDQQRWVASVSRHWNLDREDPR